MSASPVFSSAAMSRPFIFPARSSAALLTKLEALSKVASAITPASRLQVRPAPEMVSCGIRELDALIGGFPRGCLTEIFGPASSGRTSVLFAALACATRRGEVCALVDASDAMNPASAAAAGVAMDRLLWVRCRKSVPSFQFPVTGSLQDRKSKTSSSGFNNHRREWESSLEQVLKVTDLLLQSNGFGMIILDLSDVPAHSARRIPLASWFRYRQAVEHTPTVFLIMEQQPIAGSCSSVLMKVSGKKHAACSTQHAAGRLSHTELLDEFEIHAELLRSRLERKQPKSVMNFTTRAAWSG